MAFMRVSVDVNPDAEMQEKTVDPRAESPPEDNQGNRHTGILHYTMLFLIVLSLALSMFLLGLDIAILATAIPRITTTFHTMEDVGWYASALLLPFCALQLIWGKLYTFWSAQWVYLTALFIFELGSLLCGVAPSSTAFIIGRAVAGIGSGGVSTGSYVLVAHRIPLKSRPTVVGIVTAAFGLGSIVGPLIGGAFTDNPRLTWRWCFYINLPLGLFMAVVILLFIRPTKTSSGNATEIQSSKRDKARQMDFLGITFLISGVICLLLALQWGGTEYAWANGRIITLLVLGPLFLLVFIYVQISTKVQAYVTVPVRIIRNRNIWASALYGSCAVSAFFTMQYYIPIWFQVIKGATAVRSGIMTLPTVISYVVFSTLGGTLTSMTGYYAPFACISTVLMAIGTGLISTWNINTGVGQWIGYQVLFGAGSGLGIQTALTPAQALPLQDIPIGSAIVMFCQNLINSVMISVAQNMLTNGLLRYLAEEVPGVDAHDVLAMGATEISDHVASDQYELVLKAYNSALANTFYVAVASSSASVVGAVCMPWKLSKRREAP